MLQRSRLEPRARLLIANCDQDRFAVRLGEIEITGIP